MAYQYQKENLDRQREVQEAILTGERALSCLKQAREELRSASNWGLVDIFGGNFISGMIKHSRIDNAKRSMKEAQRALASFRKELQDVEEPGLQMDMGGFITFADFFFDNVLVDVLVQSKITKAKEQVEDAIRRVEAMLRELRSLSQNRR